MNFCFLCLRIRRELSVTDSVIFLRMRRELSLAGPVVGWVKTILVRNTEREPVEDRDDRGKKSCHFLRM